MEHRARVGQQAPDFTSRAIHDGAVKEITLSSVCQAGYWVILSFFPRAWSFVCPTEIQAFAARVEEFYTTKQCMVMFASTDSEACLKAWNMTPRPEGGLGNVRVPLISDSNHVLSKQFGVLIEQQGVAERALFIIDPQQIVRAIIITDSDIGRSVDEAQRLLEASQLRDVYGEACPANWQRGDESIVIPQGSVQQGARSMEDFLDVVEHKPVNGKAEEISKKEKPLGFRLKGIRPKKQPV